MEWWVGRGELRGLFGRGGIRLYDLWREVEGWREGGDTMDLCEYGQL